MMSVLTLLGLAKAGWQFLTGPNFKTYLYVGLGLVLTIAVIVAVMFHHNAVKHALARAGQEAALGERLQWQEKEKKADQAREAERRAAQKRIDALEAETASQKSKIDAQEAELEAALLSSQRPSSGPTGPSTTGAPNHLIPRGVVRALNHQGR